MDLLIVAECEHYDSQGEVLAPGHFRREIDLWARMFDRIEIITSFPPGSEPAGLEKYQSSNIEFFVGNGAFSKSLRDRVLSVGRSVVTASRILRGLIRCDAAHIRCPSRNGMLALFAQRVFRRPVYVKWAGEWPVSQAAPWSWRCQAAIVRRLRSRAVVSVYDRQESDPDWIHQTETTSLTRAQVEKAAATPRGHRPDREVILLWVGRLSRSKRVPEMIRCLERVFEIYPESRLEIVGEGPDRSAAEIESRRLGVQERVRLRGTLDWEGLADLYSRARILLLPSATEGFPKVIHEAALFGTPAIVFALGALPRIIRGRGIEVDPPGDFEAFGIAVGDCLADRAMWEQLSASASEWAAGVSLESIVDRYRALCEEAWKVDLVPLKISGERRTSSEGTR